MIAIKGIPMTLWKKFFTMQRWSWWYSEHFSNKFTEIHEQNEVYRACGAEAEWKQALIENSVAER